ncbi:MAG: helix-turn-helix transcriptional regulator [Blastocatellia bacterium]
MSRLKGSNYVDTLDTKVEALIIQKLEQPLYLRIEKSKDGKLKLEHVQFLRCEEVARITGVETRTVRNWIARGFIPHYHPPGSSVVLFWLPEVIDWILSNRAAAAA